MPRGVWVRPSNTFAPMMSALMCATALSRSGTEPPGDFVDDLTAVIEQLPHEVTDEGLGDAPVLDAFHDKREVDGQQSVRADLVVIQQRHGGHARSTTLRQH